MDRQQPLIQIPEEETSTPGRLLGIGVLAALAFLAAAAMLTGRDRLLPLVVGGGVAAAIAAFAAWLAFQRRYGEATVRPRASFEYGKPFEGVIESEMKSVPTEMVEIRLYGWSPADEGGETFSVRCVVAPSEIERTATGIEIPFRFEVPDDANTRSSRDIRLVVRTSTWPVGWGATFVVA